jgi:hypothetical protein
MIKIMSKAERLYKAKELGLPVPNFEVVKNFDEIKWIGEKEVYCGWTIRTSINDGQGFSLPFAPEISKEEIKKKILEFKEKLGERSESASFVIYPAWKFKRTGNTLISGDKIIIEAVKDTLFPEKPVPDVHYTFIKRGNGLPILENFKGDKELLNQKELLMLLDSVKKVKMDSVLIEWFFDEKKNFHVYDLVPFKEGKREDAE